MASPEKENQRKVISFLESIGAADIEPIYQRHGHPRIWFTWGGRRWYKTMSSSPGSHFSYLKAISDIKRMLGLTGVKPPISAALPLTP